MARAGHKWDTFDTGGEYVLLASTRGPKADAFVCIARFNKRCRTEAGQFAADFFTRATPGTIVRGTQETKCWLKQFYDQE